MAGKRGRRWLTPEQQAERELHMARLLGLESTRARIEFYQRLVPIEVRAVASYERLAELAVGRGERWSATYQLRRAKARLAGSQAALAALEASARAQVVAEYDAPAGAGDEVEAYRG
jgi:hypothetical protein